MGGQASEWLGVVYAAEGTLPEVLLGVAREFSPRIEPCSPREVLLDLSGLSRLFGDGRTLADAIRRTAADRGVRVRVALAGTGTAARLLVRYRAGLTVVEPGDEPSVLAPLPVELLAAIATESASATRSSADLVSTFRQWGLRTLGEVASLPADAVASRLGRDGAAWQRLARGEDARPLVPATPDERFEQALDLDWPIEGLEPLSFVLGRLLEPLAAHLVRRGRGAAVLHLRLHLVTKAVHARALQLPIPMHDARALRTVLLLDLESHPPDAAIDRVEVAAEPTPGRIVQYSLLTRPLPSPEQVSTLVARLGALMGEGRCGTPVPMDTWRPGAFAMTPFSPVDTEECVGTEADAIPFVALRRFRHPVPARVEVQAGTPCRVTTERPGLSGGRVCTCAGPWRTSGDWWTVSPPEASSDAAKPHHTRATTSWDRDEWDVALSDGATYRVFRERTVGQWFIEGVVD